MSSRLFLSLFWLLLDLETWGLRLQAIQASNPADSPVLIMDYHRSPNVVFEGQAVTGCCVVLTHVWAERAAVRWRLLKGHDEVHAPAEISSEEETTVLLGVVYKRTTSRYQLTADRDLEGARLACFTDSPAPWRGAARCEKSSTTCAVSKPFHVETYTGPDVTTAPEDQILPILDLHTEKPKVLLKNRRTRPEMEFDFDPIQPTVHLGHPLSVSCSVVVSEGNITWAIRRGSASSIIIRTNSTDWEISQVETGTENKLKLVKSTLMTKQVPEELHGSKLACFSGVIGDTSSLVCDSSAQFCRETAVFKVNNLNRTLVQTVNFHERPTYVYEGAPLQVSCTAKLARPDENVTWALWYDAETYFIAKPDNEALTITQEGAVSLRQNVTSTLTIHSVTRALNNVRVACYSFVTSNALACTEGDVWCTGSLPLKVVKGPGLPTLEVTFQTAQFIVSEGDTLVTNCTAVLGDRGVLVWNFLTAADPDNAEPVDGNRRGLDIDDVPLDPARRAMKSVLRIRSASRKLKGTRITCCSFDFTAYQDAMLLYDRDDLCAKSSPLIFKPKHDPALPGTGKLTLLLAALILMMTSVTAGFLLWAAMRGQRKLPPEEDIADSENSSNCRASPRTDKLGAQEEGEESPTTSPISCSAGSCVDTPAARDTASNAFSTTRSSQEKLGTSFTDSRV